MTWKTIVGCVALFTLCHSYVPAAVSAPLAAAGSDAEPVLAASGPVASESDSRKAGSEPGRPENARVSAEAVSPLACSATGSSCSNDVEARAGVGGRCEWMFSHVP